MNIDLKGPEALIFDVSYMTATVDEGEVLSLLAWQFVIERELVEKGGLTVVSAFPKCPSLVKQYKVIQGLLERYSLSIADRLSPHILEYLSEYVVEIIMTREDLAIIKRKHCLGSPTCRS
ncbi:hypothetical protein D9M68_20140 [compost metagenome]